MPETDDIALLKQYAESHSEAAFSALVERYVHLVYSIALRQVGNPSHAEEISQAVFLILTQKAKSLGPRTILSGWLYQTARLTAANFMRSEIRRQQREQEAYMESLLTEPTPNVWQQIAPLLDDAMGHLSEKDRNVVVLRYFQNKSAAEIGDALGIDSSTAQKRITRAVGRLRKFFAKRSVAHSAESITGAISTNSVQAAPAGLAATISAAAVKSSAVAASTLTLVKGALKLMAWTKMKTAIVAGVVVLLAAGTTTVLVKKHIEAKQYTIAREPWSEVGAATPKAALQSLAWALTHDKFDRAQELVQWDEKGLAYGGDTTIQHQITLMAVLAPALKDIDSFRILSIQSTKQPNELIVKIEKTFKNKNIVPFAVTAKLRRTGGQWRAVGNIEYFESGSVSMLLPFTGSF
jgi:RNA polymerase sigma factor (sigma-70 family)